MTMMRVLLMSFLLAATSACRSEEPVLGGACEGCELVFVGLPSEIASNARIAPANEAGEPLRIEGVVRARDGKPAAGIIVYAYQTDAKGLYPRAQTRHGRLRGWARTDADGRYQFDTIRPASYPNSDIPQHVHMHIIEPGRGTYWIDDIVFTDDPLLTDRQRAQMVRGRGGPGGAATPSRHADGTWRVTRDLVLGAGID